MSLDHIFIPWLDPSCCFLLQGVLLTQVTPKVVVAAIRNPHRAVRVRTSEYSFRDNGVGIVSVSSSLVTDEIRAEPKGLVGTSVNIALKALVVLCVDMFV